MKPSQANGVTRHKPPKRLACALCLLIMMQVTTAYTAKPANALKGTRPNMILIIPGPINTQHLANPAKRLQSITPVRVKCIPGTAKQAGVRR